MVAKQVQQLKKFDGIYKDVLLQRRRNIHNNSKNNSFIHRNNACIRPANVALLPEEVQAKAKQLIPKEAQSVTGPLLLFANVEETGDAVPAPGDKVLFKVYTDHDGAGACDIVKAPV